MFRLEELYGQDQGGVIAEVARHGLRTEEWAVRRKLAPLDASTTGENLDESIFTRVTKCHKKHAFTRSRPRSHSRRRASDFTRALARAACAPPPTAAPHRCTTQRHSGQRHFHLFGGRTDSARACVITQWWTHV